MQSDSPKLLKLQNGDTLRYGEYGDPEGCPTLFFHGWPGSRLEGAFIGDSAESFGLRIIAPDRFTDHQIGLNDYYREWADVIIALLDSLGISSIDVLAVSGGAPHAYALMYYYPKKVNRVTVVCGMVPLQNSYKLTPLFGLGKWAYRHVPFLIERALRFLKSRFERTPKTVLKVLIFITAGRDRETLKKPSNQHFITDNVLEATDSGIETLYREISFMLHDWGFSPLQDQKQITLWHGDKDKVIPLDYVETFLRHHDCIDFHLLGGEGHYSIAMENIREILQIHIGKRIDESVI